MPGFNLYTSNQPERLADHLAHIIKKHPLPFFTPETVVVQSRGMARWLTMNLADRLRVWANGNFPFPNHFITDIIRKLLPDQENPPLYEREKGVWQVMTMLQELMDHPSFLPLRSYQTNALKRFQLALKIADLFDQYIIFRPDLIADWDQGKGEHWQAELWYRLGGRYQQSHRGELRNRLLTCLNRHDVSHLLPERISVFGISSLPPFHLSILEGLSRQTDIHFFLINPCRHWWGHIMDAGRIARRVKKDKKSPEELYLEKGNALLASMGDLGRDFLAMLQELETDELEDFVEPGGATMLAAVQRDILELVDGSENGIPADDSIVIHSCHGPMREVEVLHDHLLHLFETDPDLHPRDIVVMAPDINAYSPLVEAVFGAVQNSDRYIPYNIGDRGQNQENSLAPLLLDFLDLAGSRFEVSRVLDILYTRQIRQRYALSEEDLDLIRDWLNKASIRWGRDREHLRSLELPLFDEYCWRSGLDRLLLGQCMNGEGVFGSLAPLNEMEEGDRDLLARMLEALSGIFTRTAGLERQQTLMEWAAALEDILNECLSVGPEEEDDLQDIRVMIRDMGLMGEELSCREAFPLEVIREAVERKLRDKTSVSGYLGGGVTFCSLLPMRAVPFKVVCIMGLNDGAFPRIQSRSSFDLIAASPRPGDRSRRLDDRYLFLEALISARKQLYLSYAGQSVHDNSEQPPSVLIEELLDYLKRITGAAEGGSGSRQGCRESRDFITRHRLQPFHPDYFRSDSQLFSYSTTDYEAAVAFMNRGRRETFFDFWQDLPLSPEPDAGTRQRPSSCGGKDVSLNELTDFLIHPVRFFCRTRLGVDFRQKDFLPDDEEPVKLEGLSLYQLGVEMMASEPGQLRAEKTEELFRARGLLPPGDAGKTALSGLQAEMQEFGSTLRDYDSPLLRPLPFEVPCGSHTLSGTLSDLRENGVVQARPARLKGRDILRAWLRHLVLCVLAEDDETLVPSTVVIGKDSQFILGGVSSPLKILLEILGLYQENARRPLPLFSESSHVFAREMLAGRPEQARRKAEKEWLGSERFPGEGDDPYLRFRYRQGPPLDKEFEDLALRMFRPVYEYRM